VQDGLLATDYQCVSGIVTTLEACYHAGLVGKQVYNLALAFIAPLGTQYYY
jgi:hypothetical protein